MPVFMVFEVQPTSVSASEIRFAPNRILGEKDHRIVDRLTKSGSGISLSRQLIVNCC